jgi:hypothetical protein
MRRSLDDKGLHLAKKLNESIDNSCLFSNFEVDTKRDVFDLFDNPIRQGDKTVYWRRSSENTGKYRFS